MHDVVTVSGVQRVRDINRDGERLLQRKRTGSSKRAARLAVHQLQDEIRSAIGLADVVQSTDVGMVQLRQDARFPLETRPELRVQGQVLVQDFDRDRAVEPRVPSARYTSPIPPAPRADRFGRPDACRRVATWLR